MNISYTRYADDLTFSSNKKNILFEIPKIIQQHLISIFNGKLRINKNKTFFSSKGHNRHVTGITLTNQNTLSLGRDKKRYLKSLVHQFTLGRFDADQLYHLQGWLAFAKHVDPIFIASLNKKYTSEIILAITKAQK
jgi:retron-type reverse transcriptase